MVVSVLMKGRCECISSSGYDLSDVSLLVDMSFRNLKYILTIKPVRTISHVKHNYILIVMSVKNQTNYGSWLKSIEVFSLSDIWTQ